MAHATASAAGHSSAPTGRYLAVLSLTALGVVYGDIGTSPLYAIKECFHHAHLEVNRANVLGVLSLVIWSLMITISVKYLAYVTRADNDGEGGILALMALALNPKKPVNKQLAIFALGLFGAALLYGDGMIAPAISVLSAVEGVKLVLPGPGGDPDLSPAAPWIVPITIVILVFLFWLQRRGTAGIGIVFGPIMMLWFTVLASLGVYNAILNPTVLAAVSPHYAVEFFIQNKGTGFIVLGSVFLVVTGGESLYGDMGHFGPRPIRLAWFVVVLPALLMNYVGQCALILYASEQRHLGPAQQLRYEHVMESPFYNMLPEGAPDWALIPLVMFAMCATVIASQAVISGTFSLTRQAIMLGYAPRLHIHHTSAREEGQIFIPSVNWGLLAATIILVVSFRRSSNLAAAYGIAVTVTMVITTLLASVVARRKWKWPLIYVVPLTLVLSVIDFSFFSANALKIFDGGWVPLFVAATVFVLMSTWKKGREILSQRIMERTIPLEEFPRWLAAEAPVTVPGTAVYMTGNAASVPPALMENVRHNHSLHERVIFLSIIVTQNARVSVSNRVQVEPIDDRFVRVRGYYGFTEQPDVPKLLELAVIDGIDVDMATTTFVMGRETLLASERPGMAQWREGLFAFMSRNARRAASFFRIPSERVLEVGSQIEL